MLALAQVGPVCPPIKCCICSALWSALPTPDQDEHPSLLRDPRALGCGSPLIEGKGSQAQSPDGAHLSTSWCISHPGLCQLSRQTLQACASGGAPCPQPQATVTATRKQWLVPGPAWSGVFSLMTAAAAVDTATVTNSSF